MIQKKTIYLRADASSSIGYGHFVRSLALAQILKDTFSCIFVTVNATAYQISEMEKLGSYIILYSEYTHFQDFLSILKGDEIVVLDNYFFDVDYQKKIKDNGNVLVCIDDRKNIEYYCDVIINHVIGIKKEDIIGLYPNMLRCLGVQFAIMRSCFLISMKENYPISSTKKVLVAMGGTDYLNYSYLITKHLLENSDYEVHLLIGDGYRFISSLDDFKDKSRIKVHKNLEAEEIVELVKDVLLVVSPPSTFAYEVCSVGRPLIVIPFAPGHLDVAYLLESNQLVVNCENLESLSSFQFISLVRQLLEKSEYYIGNQKKIFNGSQSENLLNIFKSFL